MRATSSRLEKALKADGDLKLVVYMMAGHPNRKKSVEVAKRLAASGVAAIEIGVPHSDPLADGPVIQKAGQIALDHGMTVDACLELASEVSGVGAPVVLMSYVNPILAHDPRRFAADAAQAAGASHAMTDRRPVYFRGTGFVATPCYARGALAPGMSFEGPAIVTQDDSAPLVAPGFRARVDDADNILLERSRG